LRVTAVGTMAKPPQQDVPQGTAVVPTDAFRGRKDVHFSGIGLSSTPVYLRTRLLAGNRIAGPALIEEHASTTVVAPGDALVVDRLGNIDIAIAIGRTV
jgi:N-methylhydantoinase A